MSLLYKQAYMNSISGIGKNSRIKLSKVLANCPTKLITPGRVVEILKIPKLQARRLLQYWENNGWLHRIRRGLYKPLSIEGDVSETAIEDPWIVAKALFSPCYIGGWSAVEFWNLTDQIFQTITIITSHRFAKRDFKIREIQYRLKMTSEKAFFGLKNIWRDTIKVQVSDPSKTIIDLLNDPSLVGGMCLVIDFFKEYLDSDHKSLNKLLEYGSKMGNCTIFKRLGFIMEALQPLEIDFIDKCKTHISKGRSQFDPTAKGNKFISKWRLLVSPPFFYLGKEMLND